jgi:hypothetical protein
MAEEKLACQPELSSLRPFHGREATAAPRMESTNDGDAHPCADPGASSPAHRSEHDNASWRCGEPEGTSEPYDGGSWRRKCAMSLGGWDVGSEAWHRSSSVTSSSFAATAAESGGLYNENASSFGKNTRRTPAPPSFSRSELADATAHTGSPRSIVTPVSSEARSSVARQGTSASLHRSASERGTVGAAVAVAASLVSGRRRTQRKMDPVARYQ